MINLELVLSFLSSSHSWNSIDSSNIFLSDLVIYFLFGGLGRRNEIWYTFMLGVGR